MTERSNASSTYKKPSRTRQASPSLVSHKLKLFMSKTRNDEPWLLVTDVDRMSKGEIPERIRDILTVDYEMLSHSLLTLSPLATAQPCWNSVHVIVHVPELVWLHQVEQDPVYALDKRTLCFVDREQAFELLQSIHQSVYHASHRGDSFRHIPIVDHAQGMGKTTFAQHYIRMCREKWRDEASRNKFQSVICAAHTVICSMDLNAFRCNSSLGATMNDMLAEAVRKCLPEGTELSVLTAPLPESSHAFARSLVAAVGPIFVVLDDIGLAFGDDGANEAASRDRFVMLCEEVLLPWAMVPGLFFIVSGHAPFLRYLKTKNTSMVLKPWHVNHLPLFRICTPQIQDILCRTIVKYGPKKKKKKTCRLMNGSLLLDLLSRFMEELWGTDGNSLPLHLSKKRQVSCVNGLVAIRGQLRIYFVTTSRTRALRTSSTKTQGSEVGLIFIGTCGGGAMHW